jgi:hypothetical protein
MMMMMMRRAIEIRFDRDTASKKLLCSDALMRDVSSDFFY